MKLYVEAYYPDHTPILGNGDGQGVLKCTNYRRTKHYKMLRGGLLSKRVAYYKLVTPEGTEVTRVYPRHHHF